MSALTLKIIACIAMLLDHVGALLGILPLRIVGRIAFPIFLYLIYNGYSHTSNKLRYAFRLGIFALLSQIPFSLFSYGKLLHGVGNVFFTLFMSLLCLIAAEKMKQNKIAKWFCLLPFAIMYVICLFGIFGTDYGAKAALMMAVFMLFSGEKLWQKTALVAGSMCAVFNLPLLKIAKSILFSSAFPKIDMWTALQGFSVLAFVFILMYNGKKGGEKLSPKASKLLQIGFYAFYPLHMLVLYFIGVAIA